MGIETSCDETALALIDGEKILANITLTQTVHKKYGGVFPMLAKREHAKNLLPIFKNILETANFLNLKQKARSEKLEDVKKILEREPDLLEQFLAFVPTIEKPPINAIAVTEGPGLEPALWVGINFAKALATIWNIPIIPINHMEGHVVSALLHLKGSKQILNSETQIIIRPPVFPAIALLISGGHTELVLMKNWFDYEIVGVTKDDAIGEAFDKVARILGLPYPGGPEISRLAEKTRKESKGLALKSEGRLNLKLPRPMLNSGDLNFSFSGLKTAVLYLVKKLEGLNEDDKRNIAREFEDAATEVLVTKTKKALNQFGVKTLIIGGGVSANKNIRRTFEELSTKKNDLKLFISNPELATDNALMIALAGQLRLKANKTKTSEKITAQGNLKIV